MGKKLYRRAGGSNEISNYIAVNPPDSGGRGGGEEGAEITVVVSNHVRARLSSYDDHPSFGTVALTRD